MRVKLSHARSHLLVDGVRGIMEQPHAGLALALAQRLEVREEGDGVKVDQVLADVPQDTQVLEVQVGNG